MPTNDQLRRRIAELEGWTDVYPNGGDPNADTQWLGIKPPDRHESFLPDWLTDANAALELADKIMNSDGSLSFHVSFVSDGDWEAGVTVLSGPALFRRICEHGNSFCEAICRLYVAWQEARGYSAAIANAEPKE